MGCQVSSSLLFSCHINTNTLMPWYVYVYQNMPFVQRMLQVQLLQYLGGLHPRGRLDQGEHAALVLPSPISLPRQISFVPHLVTAQICTHSFLADMQVPEHLMQHICNTRHKGIANDI